MRRVFLIAIMCALALLAVSSVGATDEITVQGQHVSTGPGGAVTFKVTGHSDKLVGAFGITIEYDDDALTPISCQANGVLCTKSAIPGQLRINGANVLGYSGDITFAKIVFAADATGVFPIGVDMTAISDTVGKDLAQYVIDSDGSVTVEGGADITPPGDANCDSEVTAADGLALLTALAGGDEACAEIADVNCDDKIDTKDALALLRALGGLTYATKGVCDPVV